jgi:ATP-binding cassette, subfamily B (MDR/TAP), member 1
MSDLLDRDQSLPSFDPTSEESKEFSALIPKSSVEISSLSYFSLFRYATRNDYLLLFLGFIFTLISAAMPVIVMLQIGEIMKIMYDNPDDYSTFYDEERKTALLNFGLSAVSLISGIIAVTSIITVGCRQSLAWKTQYFSTLLNKPIAWLDQQSIAQLGPSIDIDCTAIEHAISDKSLLLISGASVFVASWIISFWISPVICGVALCILPPQIIAGYVFKELTARSAEKAQTGYVKAGGIAEESLEGVKTVAACNAQEECSKAYQRELEPTKRSSILIGAATGVLWSICFASLFMLVAVANFIGAILIVDEPEVWGHKFTIESYQVQEVTNLTTYSCMVVVCALPSLRTIQAGMKAARRVASVIDGASKEDGVREAGKLEGKIEFEDVWFNYPTKNNVNVLKGVSFKLEPSSSLAIVGETGCGKSTIIQLIEGFYYPDSGTIRIDGVDIREYDLKSLRSRIALVSQEPLLFNCSIKENIRMGRLDASDGEIEKAAEQAEASEFINSLPEAYSTWVGNKGSQLSGGQKQRIAIARSLIKSPVILLLDEATSALDMNTEKQIQATLEKVMKNKTTIIVAQRLSTIKNASQIAVLGEGRIQELGTFNSLATSNSEFARFLQAHKESELESTALGNRLKENSNKKTSEETINEDLEMRPGTAIQC